jgi:hypothetical protein
MTEWGIVTQGCDDYPRRAKVQCYQMFFRKLVIFD